MTTEQRSPVNKGHYFWVPSGVVVHRFDCKAMRSVDTEIRKLNNFALPYCISFSIYEFCSFAYKKTPLRFILSLLCESTKIHLNLCKKFLFLWSFSSFFLFPLFTTHQRKQQNQLEAINGVKIFI